MKPSNIRKILDLAVAVRSQGRVFNPLFVGPPGVAKSHEVKDWAKEAGYDLIDVRTALLEAPDLIGFPFLQDGNTFFAPPSWLPKEGTKGVFFLDEINRGQTSVMNACMQMLTDRRIGTYKFPDGWIFAAAINPENGTYDVNAMDAALKDRLEMYPIEYSKSDFVAYMKKAGWDHRLVSFVEGDVWQYAPPEDFKTANPGSKYVSPRTLEKVQVALWGGVEKTQDMFDETLTAELGSIVAKKFRNHIENNSPVTVDDFLTNFKDSLRKFKEHCDPANYKAGFVQSTMDSVANGALKIRKHYGPGEMNFLEQIIPVLPMDQAYEFIYAYREHIQKEARKPVKDQNPEFAGLYRVFGFEKTLADNPTIKKYLKEAFKYEDLKEKEAQAKGAV